MAAAMAYCTSNTAFHQHALSKTRTQFTSVSHRSTLSPSTSLSSPVSKSHLEEQCIIKTIKSDENNNNHQIDCESIASNDDILYITSDDDDDGFSIIDNDNERLNDIDEEQYLSLVGLRVKTKKPMVRALTIRPLTKRLACPVCLLPLPKYGDRVRQALYIRLPFLKFLSITRDIENFCATDETAKAASLLPRSIVQARTLSTLNRNPKRTKLSKSELINMTTKTTRHSTSRISTSKYVRSILQCRVVLDRLEQSTINQIIQNSGDDDEKTIAILSTPERSLKKIARTSRSSSSSTNQTTTTTTTTRTTVTTMTTEKTIIKRKSTGADLVKAKRTKTITDDHTFINKNDTKPRSSSSTYKRIYLKCFVCSKRQYVDAEATDSDVLHSHWLEHDKDLSLNIYDSEIDSTLTRVVEFFNLPKTHTLEGKIKTVFILNSKEVRSPSVNDLSSTDSCIVID